MSSVCFAAAVPGANWSRNFKSKVVPAEAGEEEAGAEGLGAAEVAGAGAEDEAGAGAADVAGAGAALVLGAAAVVGAGLGEAGEEQLLKKREATKTRTRARLTTGK